MAKQTQKTSAKRLLTVRVWFVAVFALLLAAAMVFAAENTFLQDVAIDNINTTAGTDLIIAPSSSETNITGTLKVSGQIWSSVTGFKFPDGTTMSTAAASGISGSGAANYLAIWNGTSKLNKTQNLYWDPSNKRLGIGTVNPSGTLHVEGNEYIGYSAGTAAGVLYFYQGTGGTAGNTPSIRADWNQFYLTNNNGKVMIEVATDESHALGIQEGGSPWDTLNWWYDGSSAGGTGMWMHTGANAGSMNFKLGESSGVSSFNVLSNGGTNLMAIKSSGNVGIGTTSPSTKLQVKGTLDLGNNTIQGVTNIKIKSGGNDHQMYNDGSNDMVIKAGTGGDVIIMVG
jgi:hypothetical protein